MAQENCDGRFGGRSETNSCATICAGECDWEQVSFSFVPSMTQCGLSVDCLEQHQRTMDDDKRNGAGLRGSPGSRRCPTREEERDAQPVPPRVSTSPCPSVLHTSYSQPHRHHHVESVHFKATGGRDLHPALAVVQTPHREYYILRDNGMQVGCEEDGVAEVWQEVLRCDVRGVPLLS